MPRMALRVLRPKSPTLRDKRNTQNGVSLADAQPYGYRVVPYRVGTTAYNLRCCVSYETRGKPRQMFEISKKI